jgi:hypothetical protein
MFRVSRTPGAEFHRNELSRSEHLAVAFWRALIVPLNFNLLVVVRGFHFRHPVMPPDKTDSVLIVDANAVLSLSVSF